MIADGWRSAFAALCFRPLDTFDGIVRHRVLFAEILEERRQCGQPVADRAPGRIPFGGAADLPALEVIASGDDMRARDDPEFLGPDNAGETHEVADGVFID